jgi:hypothetical protein
MTRNRRLAKLERELLSEGAPTVGDMLWATSCVQRQVAERLVAIAYERPQPEYDRDEFGRACSVIRRFYDAHPDVRSEAQARGRQLIPALDRIADRTQSPDRP